MADISLDDLIKAKTQTMDNNADAQNWQVMTKKVGDTGIKKRRN